MVRQRSNRDSESVVLVAKRSNYVILALFVVAVYGSWFVYEQQYLNLPKPLGAQQVGKRGFSEHEAIQHVIALTQFGPHPVGSPALDHALQYVLQAIETIKETAHWEVDVELDLFHAKSGANHMVGGLFKGKTLVYSDLNHIVLRISPKYAAEATENAILVSSHIDTVFSATDKGCYCDFVSINQDNVNFSKKEECASNLAHDTILRFLEISASTADVTYDGSESCPSRFNIQGEFLHSGGVIEWRGNFRLTALEGAGDCSSCVAVMLELARGVSQWAHGFKNAVIFLFNTGEEEGLNGAHSFITQHPWSDTVTMAIDLEAMGVGGKSGIFQAGPQPWAIENFALAAKYPSGQIVAQDLFKSGAIKSATDFQVYQELAGLSGLDFAYADNTAVYHTKNDKLKLLKPGSLQHLGENMLAFLLKAGTSTNLPKGKGTNSSGKSGQDTAIYFDILGTYMVVFRQYFASLLYNTVILQALLIWTTSVIMGGRSAMVSLALSSLSLVLMWMCAIGFSVFVAFILPLVSSSPIPYISSPWLVVGLFGAPAVLGAFTGQHVGYLILLKYLTKTFSRRNANLPLVVQEDLAKLDAERWLFKAGLLQWLILLIVGNFYKIGSSYLALAWLAAPAFAYGLLEATLSPARLPKPLKTVTLLIGSSVPCLLSSGIIIHSVSTLIGSAVRLERLWTELPARFTIGEEGESITFNQQSSQIYPEVNRGVEGAASFLSCGGTRKDKGSGPTSNSNLKSNTGQFLFLSSSNQGPKHNKLQIHPSPTENLKNPKSSKARSREKDVEGEKGLRGLKDLASQFLQAGKKKLKKRWKIRWGRKKGEKGFSPSPRKRFAKHSLMMLNSLKKEENLC
ncbi:hypothetical protein MTR67_018735 [Solanum verrucosum]|uniref:Vacuolar membrane protease n=1 Tax=Solanum verrucosum TaxID=315347 RepID=A0AAF0QQD4_SOLVR|nr:hypothetical protein MTR67_018735 [Solanum verrucosum]